MQSAVIIIVVNSSFLGKKVKAIKVNGGKPSRIQKLKNESKNVHKKWLKGIGKNSLKT